MIVVVVVVIRMIVVSAVSGDGIALMDVVVLAATAPTGIITLIDNIFQNRSHRPTGSVITSTPRRETIVCCCGGWSHKRREKTPHAHRRTIHTEDGV